MTRRSVFKTLALAPAGVLLSQEESTGTEAMDFSKRGAAIYSQGQVTQANLDELSIYAEKMVRVITPESKAEMERLLRSDWSILYDANTEYIPFMYRCNGMEIPLYGDTMNLLKGGGGAYWRPYALAFLDQVGIQGFVDELPNKIKHPMCANDPYLEGYLAGVSLISTGLGVATMLGCALCGPIALGMGVAVAVIKAVKVVGCS